MCRLGMLFYRIHFATIVSMSELQLATPRAISEALDKTRGNDEDELPLRPWSGDRGRPSHCGSAAARCAVTRRKNALFCCDRETSAALARRLRRHQQATTICMRAATNLPTCAQLSLRASLLLVSHTAAPTAAALFAGGFLPTICVCFSACAAVPLIPSSRRCLAQHSSWQT